MGSSYKSFLPEEEGQEGQKQEFLSQGSTDGESGASGRALSARSRKKEEELLFSLEAKIEKKFHTKFNRLEASLSKSFTPVSVPVSGSSSFVTSSAPFFTLGYLLL